MNRFIIIHPGGMVGKIDKACSDGLLWLRQVITEIHQWLETPDDFLCEEDNDFVIYGFDA